MRAAMLTAVYGSQLIRKAAIEMAVMRTNFIWDFCLLTRIMWFKLPSSGTRVSPISLVKKDFRQHYSSYPCSIPARSLLDWSWSVTKSDTKQKAFPPLPLKSVRVDEPVRWRLFSHRKISIFYNCWGSAASARGRSFKTLCFKMLKNFSLRSWRSCLLSAQVSGEEAACRMKRRQG